jgi:hypothetical protein
MIDARFKPIERWVGAPTPDWKRQSSRFKAGWSQTLDLLEKELSHLRAKDITIEGYFQAREIRNDGWPKSSARPTQPGIVLSFETKRGRMVMPCDRFKDWEANLRAIALTLEHLRAVERYGVTTEEQEQYTGWLRLPAASKADEVTSCATVLARHALLAPTLVGVLASDFEQARSAYRTAARYTHPDTSAAPSADFLAVTAAWTRLKELKGWGS